MGAACRHQGTTKVPDWTLYGTIFFIRHRNVLRKQAGLLAGTVIMYDTFRKIQKRQSLLVVMIMSFLLPVWGSGIAESSWWDKGTKLLNSLTESQSKNSLTTEEIGLGLKDALRIGTEKVVAQLGREDGFYADTAVHIPLPKGFDTVKSTLDKVGMSYLLNDLERKLNRAAEAATPKAKTLFWQAITEMTFDDVKAIYEGPEDAATSYFQTKMSGPLREAMRPIIQSSLSQVGAVRVYDNIMAKYNTFPFVPEVKADLTAYTIEKAMVGLFYYIAQEEAAIRQDPAKRTTEILKRVFGSQ
jgi:hypothetical protein